MITSCPSVHVISFLFTDRCKRMIIVLSPDFLTSEDCNFQTKFAHSIAPSKSSIMQLRLCKMMELTADNCSSTSTKFKQDCRQVQIECIGDSDQELSSCAVKCSVDSELCKHQIWAHCTSTIPLSCQGS